MANLRQIARQKAKKYGVDPDIFERQIGAESGFSPRAKSPAGALGVAQIMPGTARSWGVNPADPVASLDAAARNMARMVKKHGSYEAALRGYNAGEGAIEKSKGYAETNAYVKKILTGGEPTGGARVQAASSSGAQALQTKTTGPTVAPEGLTREGVLQQYLMQRGRPGATVGLAQGLGSLKAPTATVAAPAAASSSNGGAKLAAGGPRGQLLELFWQGEDGINVKNGKLQPQGFVPGHKDHVHVAADPKDVIRLARMAQRLGLAVRENPAYDPVDPVHTKGSHHYRTRKVNGKQVGYAIDVSGDVKKMAQYAREVARTYGAS